MYQYIKTGMSVSRKLESFSDFFPKSNLSQNVYIGQVLIFGDLSALKIARLFSIFNILLFNKERTGKCHTITW